MDRQTDGWAGDGRTKTQTDRGTDRKTEKPGLSSDTEQKHSPVKL